MDTLFFSITDPEHQYRLHTNFEKQKTQSIHALTLQSDKRYHFLNLLDFAPLKVNEDGDNGSLAFVPQSRFVGSAIHQSLQTLAASVNVQRHATRHFRVPT